MNPERGSDVSPTDIHRAVAAGELWLLDVREPAEWQDVRTELAHHIPLREVGGRQDELPEDAPIAVICHVGGRSRHLTDRLTEAGYFAVNVEGGILAWESAGLPVRRGSLEQG